MADFESWPVGKFCWTDLSTSDVKSANDFYAKLFGWTYNANPMGEGEFYYLAQIRGRDVAGTSRMPAELSSQGVPPHWTTYVAVADAEATAQKIQKHGGQILAPAFDVFEHGRMAVAADPTGASFAIWQAKEHKGYRVAGEHGSICWNELCTTDTDVAGAFYQAVFGWNTEDSGLPEDPEKPMKYTMFGLDGNNFAGMMKIDPAWGPMPPNWGIYFAVDDCDATFALAQTLGGKVIVPPMDIPNIGRFCTLQDPQGAVFSVIKVAM